MLFPSKEFLFIFLPVVMAVYYLILRKTKNLKNIWLLLASLFFYAYGEPVYVYLMIGTVLANYLYGILVDKFRGKMPLVYIIIAAMVITNLGILGYFKYYRFTVLQINRFAHSNISVPEIALPIGISFFTFQAMSYVFDVYRQKGKVQYNPLKVGLYIALFPQLIAGPIVRYETIADQIDNRKENFDDFSKGVYRFMVGLCKKVLIANNLAMVADSIFERVGAAGFDGTVALAWLGGISYTLQIFFDFAGYSDMAIGLGQMFGFHFEENFNYPYVAHNITDFWRRWHISMQTWFRDYLYFPMGGSRVKMPRLIFNMFVVWLCTGIWHGANWTYLAWGILNLCLLLFERFTGIAKKKNIILRLYTLVAIVVSMVVFRSTGLGSAAKYVMALFGIHVTGAGVGVVAIFLRRYWIYYIFAIVAAVPVVPWLEKKFSQKEGATATVFNIVEGLVLLFMFLLSMTFIFGNAYSPFIYFNF